jgi:CheY-like chemotaxis protein
MNVDAFMDVRRRNESGGKDDSKPSKLFHGPHVLIADDEEIIRRFISHTLVKAGISVTAVSDGQEAWEALQKDHYDLVVTDNEMPHLTGLKLIERMRKADLALPVIVASGSFSRENLPNLPQLQITAVLPKPFGASEFLDMVRNVLSSQAELKPIPQRDELNPKLCRH